MTPPSELQRRIFVAMPGPELGRREAAKRIAEAFARRAYRRPPSGDEVNTLLGIYDLAEAQDEDFTEAVKLMVKAALMSPQFLFITPDAPVDRDQEIIALGDHQPGGAAVLPDPDRRPMPDAVSSAASPTRAACTSRRWPRARSAGFARRLRAPRRCSMGFGAQ